MNQIGTDYARLIRLAFPAVARRHRAQIKAWAARNRPICNAATKRWRARNPQYNWAKLNPKAACRLSKNWQKRNPEKAAAGAGRYRARKRKATLGCPKAIWKIYARAAELRQWFDVVVDHIIPLAKGGAHASGNLQIIYRTENERKGARVDFTPSVIFI